MKTFKEQSDEQLELIRRSKREAIINYKEVISRLNGRITNLQAKIEKIEKKIK